MLVGNTKEQVALSKTKKLFKLCTLWQVFLIISCEFALAYFYFLTIKARRVNCGQLERKYLNNLKSGWASCNGHGQLKKRRDVLNRNRYKKKQLLGIKR